MLVWRIRSYDSNSRTYYDVVKKENFNRNKRRISADELISYTFLVWRQCVHCPIWITCTFVPTYVRVRLMSEYRLSLVCSYRFWMFSTVAAFFRFDFVLGNCLFVLTQRAQCDEQTPMQGPFFLLQSSRWTCFSMAVGAFVVIVVAAIDGSRHVGILSTFQRRQQKYYCDDSLVLSGDCWTVRYSTCADAKIRF